MAENVSSLTPKQEQFIAALLTPHTIGVAAVAAGVSERTAHRWLKEPLVKDALRLAQKELFTEALASLVHKVDKAIETLDRNMDGEDTPASTQVNAARIVIEQAIVVHKMSELEDLEKKVAELEELIGTLQSNGNIR